MLAVLSRQGGCGLELPFNARVKGKEEGKHSVLCPYKEGRDRRASPLDAVDRGRPTSERAWKEEKKGCSRLGTTQLERGGVETEAWGVNPGRTHQEHQLALKVQGRERKKKGLMEELLLVECGEIRKKRRPSPLREDPAFRKG